MRLGWNVAGLQLHTVGFAFLILHLHFHGSFSLNPEGFSFLEFLSQVKIDPFAALQNWDPRDDDPCKWSGFRCVDGRVDTFFLCENKFDNGIPSWMEKANTIFHMKNNKIVPCDAPGEIKCVNQKVWHWSKLKNKYLRGHGDKVGNNFFTTLYISQPVHDLHIVRRHLLQESKNLPSAEVSSAPPHTVSVPSHGSGSFPAIPNSNGSRRKAPPPDDLSSVAVLPDTLVKQENKSTSTTWPKWIFTVIIPITVLFLIIIMALIVVYRGNAIVIDAWRTGLSGPLQNALITGVPKLNRAELQAACEDFSNIIMTYPNCTVFKGILSSGVEIAVVSTKATSKFDWSERSDSQFRNKIDTISKINHKNFVNLLGFCKEDDPFMRMMVFEYAPNGTLFEHLHVKDFGHLDWSTRMRIIMGIAYCLEYMHDLKPSIVHPILQSNCIFITDDYAAKIADLGIFSEPIGKEKYFLNDNNDNSMAAPTIHPESNVYSFGILLLEIISGRMPISEENRLPISDWAMERLKDKKTIKSLVDSSLISHKDNELQIICKAAEACIHKDPKSRPTMKEVSASLKEVIGVDPEAAVPRLSPLWWAELEVLSIEAS